MSSGPPVIRLISDHLDGALDAPGRARLEGWLAEDPAHRQRFVRMAMDHAALKRLASVMAAKPPTLRTRRILARRRPQPWLMPFALAASLMLAAAGGWWRWSGSAGSPAPAGDHRPLLASAPRQPLLASARGVAATIGSRLSAGTPLVTAADGMATLRWDDGSEVHLDAGTEVEIGDGIAVRLVRGRIAAELAAQPSDHPACFTTSEADVFVVGTALAIAAGDGESSAEVGHGRVRVRQRSTAAEAMVGAGECVAIAPGLPLRVRPIGSPAGVVHRVMAGGDWPDQASVHPGDLIELASGIHPGSHRLTASGTLLRPIVVRGAGMDATVLDATSATTSGEHSGPRGVLQVEGRHVAIRDLTLRGARNATANAAGVRMLDGADGIALSGCRIAGCDSGMMADPGPGSLLVEDCVIAGNGIDSRARSTGNLKLANRDVTIRGCRISDARFGVNVELRDGTHHLIGNRIGGGAEGEIGIVLSGPGRNSVELAGNLIASEPRAQGSNRSRFIYVHRPTEVAGTLLLAIHASTLVAGEPSNWMIDAPGCTVELTASIVAGSPNLATAGTVLAGTGNCLPAEASDAGLGGTVRGAPGFIDAAAGDYRLLPTSPCHGAAPATPPLPRLAPPGVMGGAAPRSPDGNIGAY
jgi:ferric-dicitrate binding protein FerR (iron transport regulator)